MRYNLICENEGFRVHSKTVFLIISTTTSLILLMFADKVGRRRIMKISCLLVMGGMMVAAIYPGFLEKMLGLGLVAGGEGTFSVLFTIYINENTRRSTKIRSALVSVSFLAYAIGCVLFNAFAYITTNPNILAATVGIILVCSVSPSYFFFYETPYFLYKKGRITELFDTLMSIYKKNQGSHGIDETLYIGVENQIITLMGINTHITNKAWFKSTTILLKKKRKQHAERSNSLIRLCASKKHLYHVIALISIGGLLYMLFYGMSINIQELGLKDIKLNGILLGVTQALGYIAVTPFTHRMKRKFWFILFQIALFIGALILFFLSQQNQTSTVQFEQTITSTFWMSSLMSAVFPFFFIYITEAFPTEVRGTANAIILFSAKMIGCMSPILESFSVKHHVHVVASCSVLVFLSLPLTCFIKETLTYATN